ncbi:MAG: CRISPR system precrRNA processing endoribonuclease RAMP protein Cas6 [Chloroflexota bacterium]
MIPTLTLDFDIRSETPIRFRGFPGVALRGAVFQALDVLYTGNDPSFAKSYQTDPLLHLMMRQNKIDTITKSTVSPFVIRSPLHAEERNLTFGISLFGRARNLLPYVTSAVQAMGTNGIGTSRNKFDVLGVRQSKDTYLSVFKDQSLKIDSWKSVVEFSEYTRVQKINIHFLTPTTIIQDKKLHCTPEFGVWFHRLLERILHLKSLTDADEKWIPVNDLLARAERINTIQDSTQCYGLIRYKRNSRRIVGFYGNVQYTGDFSQLLPYIMLGERLHVGKNTVKGCGRYIVEVLE